MKFKFKPNNCFNLTFPLALKLQSSLCSFVAIFTPSPSGTEKQVKQMLGARLRRRGKIKISFKMQGKIKVLF
jgi:hypothetical protein